MIPIPQQVQQNLIALRMERDQAQRGIQLILSTMLAMNDTDSNEQYQLSDDCSQLVKVATDHSD